MKCTCKSYMGNYDLATIKRDRRTHVIWKNGRGILGVTGLRGVGGKV